MGNGYPEFEVGDKVVFGYVPDDMINGEIRNAMKHPYLTITSKQKNTTHGRYGTKEAGNQWSGLYWKLYDCPNKLDDDLFEL